MEKVHGVKEGKILSFDDFGDLRRLWHLSRFQILALAAGIAYEKEHNLPLSMSRAPFNPIPINNNNLKRKISDLGDYDHQKKEATPVVPMLSIDLNSGPDVFMKIIKKKPRTSVGVPRKNFLHTSKKKVDVPVHKSSEKQQHSSDSSSSSSELSAQLRRKILELGGSQAVPKMVFEKVLTATDVDRGQARLTMSANSSTLKLTDTEEADARRKDGRVRVPGFEVLVIDPSLNTRTMNFKKWRGINAYALNGSWNDLVRENRLKEGDKLQVWSFKRRNQLCFALVKV